MFGIPTIHEPKPIVEYISGLDLGQAQDYTALAVMERKRDNDSKPWMYSIRYLERFPLGTPYPVVCDRCVQIFANPPLKNTRLAVDQTGVGRAVVDMLRKAKPKCTLRPITITGGHNVVTDSSGWHVPKKELVSAMQAVLQSRRLLVAKSLPLAAVLMKELETFKVKITTSLNETFSGWRENDKDDICLAVMMGLWVAERASKKFWLGGM